jgi:hypothetical protein
MTAFDRSQQVTLVAVLSPKCRRLLTEAAPQCPRGETDQKHESPGAARLPSTAAV